MSQEIIINGFSLIGDLKLKNRINEKTKNNINHITFEAEILGYREFNNYSNAIEHNELNIEIPSENIKFKGRKNGYSSSYTDLENKEQILYHIKINIDEIDKDEVQSSSGDNFFVNMGINTTRNWARTRALSELLIEKGLFTKEEYEEKIDFVWDRDREEFISSFNQSIESSSSEEEEHSKL